MTGNLHRQARELLGAVGWRLAERGLCPWLVFRGHCGEQSDPESEFGYCPAHEARNQAQSDDGE